MTPRPKNDDKAREDRPTMEPTPPIAVSDDELRRLRDEQSKADAEAAEAAEPEDPAEGWAREAAEVKARWKATVGGRTGPIVVDGQRIDAAIRARAHLPQFDPSGWAGSTPAPILEDSLRAMIADPPDPFEDRQVILVIDGGHLNAFIRWAGDWYSFDTPLRHPDMSWSSTLAVMRSSRGEIVIPAPGIVMQAPNRDA